MKTKSLIVLAILMVLTTTSSRCVNINIGSGITGSDNFITRDFKVGAFDKLDLSAVAEIYYTQSTDGTTSFQLNGPDNIVELVKVDVKDNTLTVRMKKKNIKKSKLKITITSPDIKSLKMSGVGNFNINEVLNTDQLTIRNSGVGDVRIAQLNCDIIDLLTEGVGNIRINGQAGTATLVSKGVGNIDADKLIARDVVATSNGVGNVSCHATQSIQAKVNGVGNIKYGGNPAQKDIRKNGIGSIKQK